MRQPDRPTYDRCNENQRLVREARESTLLFGQVREDAAHIKQNARELSRRARTCSVDPMV